MIKNRNVFAIVIKIFDWSFYNPNVLHFQHTAHLLVIWAKRRSLFEFLTVLVSVTNFCRSRNFRLQFRSITRNYKEKTNVSTYRSFIFNEIKSVKKNSYCIDRPITLEEKGCVNSNWIHATLSHFYVQDKGCARAKYNAPLNATSLSWIQISIFTTQNT